MKSIEILLGVEIEREIFRKRYALFECIRYRGFIMFKVYSLYNKHNFASLFYKFGSTPKLVSGYRHVRKLPKYKFWTLVFIFISWNNSATHQSLSLLNYICSLSKYFFSWNVFQFCIRMKDYFSLFKFSVCIVLINQLLEKIVSISMPFFSDKIFTFK